MNYKIKMFIIILTGVSLVSCSKKSDVAPTEAHGHETGHDHEAHQKHEEAKSHEDHGGHGGHEGHGHGENGVSDLDRPVAELFSEACEHDIKTHECDECRYEVGVVKAVASLFKDGLLKTTKADKRVVAEPLRLTGEVQFDERLVAHVSTLVVGIIRKVHVTLGDKVKKGKALLEIESVEAGNAKASLQEALAMEKLARKNNDRIEALRKEGISSQKEVLLAKQELESAEIRAKAARGTVKRLGMGRSNSQGKLVLRAPADGTILGMHAVSGEVAKSEESLVTIGDNSSLWVWADLYEKNFALVSEAQSISALHTEVSVKAFANRTFPGSVDFISPSMSESSRTIKVRIAVPNPEGKLLAGMFANVDIFLPGNQKALSLPRGALLEDEGRSFVFVHHKDDYYIRRPVVLGGEFNGWVEIKSGIKGNEIIVADGTFLLKSDVLRSKMGAGCAD